jgi:hypothetical protein
LLTIRQGLWHVMIENIIRSFIHQHLRVSMSFFSKLLNSIGIKRESQALQPTKVNPPMGNAPAAPVTPPTPATPAIPTTPPAATTPPRPGAFNANRGNQTQDNLRNQNLKREMMSWLQRNYAPGMDDVDIELRLDRPDENKLHWTENPLWDEVLSEFFSGQMATIEQYPDMSVQEIEQFVQDQKSRGKKDAVQMPAEIANNPRNMELYEKAVSRLSDQGEFGQEAYEQESAPVNGMAPEELADIFYNNFLNVSDDHENPEDSRAYQRFMELNRKFPDMDLMDVLTSRVFRGVPGGYDSRGQQKEDFRYKFFVENAGWLGQMGMLPASVQQMLDSGSGFGNNAETYAALDQDADMITSTLAYILSSEDEMVKDRVWDWVSSKFGSQAMQDKYRARQNAVDEDGGELQHSEDQRLNQLRSEPSEPSLDEDQRSEIMDAYRGDISSMANIMRDLGGDIRQELLKRDKFQRGGSELSKSVAAEFFADQSAHLLEELLEEGFDSDKLREFEQKGYASFRVGDDNKIKIQPAKGQGWDSIQWENMLSMKGKLNTWIDMYLSEDEFEPDSYKDHLRSVERIGNTKVDRQTLEEMAQLREQGLIRDAKPNTEQSKTDRNKQIEMRQTGRAKELEKVFWQLKSKIHHHIEQLLPSIGDLLTSEEIQDKYPPNVILTYLDMIKTKKTFKELGHQLSSKSPQGHERRVQMLKESPEAFGIADPNVVDQMSPQDIYDRTIAYIEQEVQKSKTSKKAPYMYRDILDRQYADTALAFYRGLSIIKTAVTRLGSLRKVASSMTKFASVEGIRLMMNDVRNDMREKLSSL